MPEQIIVQITKEHAELLSNLKRQYKAKPVKGVKALQMTSPFQVGEGKFQEGDYLVFLDDGDFAGMSQQKFENSFEQVIRNRLPKIK